MDLRLCPALRQGSLPFRLLYLCGWNRTSQSLSALQTTSTVVIAPWCKGLETKHVEAGSGHTEPAKGMDVADLVAIAVTTEHCHDSWGLGKQISY